MSSSVFDMLPGNSTTYIYIYSAKPLIAPSVSGDDNS